MQGHGPRKFYPRVYGSIVRTIIVVNRFSHLMEPKGTSCYRALDWVSFSHKKCDKFGPGKSIWFINHSVIVFNHLSFFFSRGRSSTSTESALILQWPRTGSERDTITWGWGEGSNGCTQQLHASWIFKALISNSWLIMCFTLHQWMPWPTNPKCPCLAMQD